MAPQDLDWPAPSPQVPSNPRPSDYINCQRKTRFGTISLVARSTRQESKVPRASPESNKTPHPQQQSHLFCLPIDLRQEIYNHLFRLPAYGTTASRIVQHSLPDKTPTILTPLLTCRLRHFEAEQIFYSIHRFFLARPADFLSTLGHRRREVIKHIILSVASPADLLHRLECLRSAIPNLTSLYIGRLSSVRFLNASEWVVMVPQIVGEI